VTVVYCAGTATDVGKTWFGAATLAALRRQGLRVAARKPVQSFDAADDGPRDAEVLAAATGEDPVVVCPPSRSYEIPMAPPMAADALGLPCPTVAELVAFERPDVDVLWVEGVGGPRSPIAADGDGVALRDALAPDVVVLVADAGLGTINAVVLSLAALGPAVVALNRYDDENDLHRRNRAWLVDRCGVEVVTSSAELAERLSS
jgi:dethiobiotin synthetase